MFYIDRFKSTILLSFFFNCFFLVLQLCHLSSWFIPMKPFVDTYGLSNDMYFISVVSIVYILLRVLLGFLSYISSFATKLSVIAGNFVYILLLICFGYSVVTIYPAYTIQATSELVEAVLGDIPKQLVTVYWSSFLTTADFSTRIFVMLIGLDWNLHLISSHLISRQHHVNILFSELI